MQNAGLRPAWLGERLRQYQRERFPLLSTAALVGMFVLAGLAAAAPADRPSVWEALAIVAVVIGLFFQLRVADEFKDAETDRCFRPERPVPRGLVSLRELAGVAIFVAAAQLLLTMLLPARPIAALLVVFAYGAAMSVEFGIGSWLKRHRSLYLLSHMIIMPLIAAFIVAAAGDPTAPASAAMAAFAALAFANGLALEIGRKIRPPAAEQNGVETYSAEWGLGAALLVWAGIVVLGAGLTIACLAAAALSNAAAAAALIVAGSVLAVALHVHRRPTRARFVEPAAGVWVLASYGAVAAAPLVA